MKGRYGIKISQNIIRALLLIILTSMVAFALMKASPVDPLQANVGQAALGSMSQEQIGKLREYWGVGTSPVRQYLSWAADFATGQERDCSQTFQFSFSHGDRLDHLRSSGICAGSDCRDERRALDR